MLRQSLLLVVLGSVAVACGGSVVFEEPADGGGGGSATGTTGTKSTSSTNSVSASTASATTTNDVATVGTSTVSTSSGPGQCQLPNTNPPQNCQQACSDVYDCGLLFCGGEPQQLCPGFFDDPMSKQQFMNFCIDVCQQQMALVSIVNPGNCQETVDTLNAVSFEFSAACGGFDG
jgi:hypothetical protein